MSSKSLTETSPTEVLFRNANGQQLILEEKGSLTISNADTIINFVLRSKRDSHINLWLTLLCIIAFVWGVLGSLIPLVLSICILTLQCKAFIVSAKQGK